MSEMTLSDFGSGLALLLTLLFGLGALLNLAGPGFVVRFYRRWDYPRGFHYVVGLIQAVTALFLAIAQTRIWGGNSGRHGAFRRDRIAAEPPQICLCGTGHHLDAGAGTGNGLSARRQD